MGDFISVAQWGLKLPPPLAQVAPYSLLTPLPAGAGYIAAMLGMVAAAVVEIVRLDVVARHGLQVQSSSTCSSSVHQSVPACHKPFTFHLCGMCGEQLQSPQNPPLSPY